MPTNIPCTNPKCAATISVAESSLGKSVRCSSCGTSFVAPSPSKSVTALGKIGRFEIRERLGAGAFGAVFRAYDPQLDREVALKVPHAAALDSSKRIERFLREAKAAARLRHPHIVPVFDAGRDGDRYFIASAYIKGRTLAEAVPEFASDPRRVAMVVRELAEALAYAHEQGIVHRDVKPANVMLDELGHVHLMDFGLATWADEASKLTNDGAVLGTPSYMSPEQATGKIGEVGPAADQYSLGVVLYELLCGHTPFSGPPATVLFHVLNTEPESPRKKRADVPADLDVICRKSMAKQVGDRFPNCGELSADLRRWLDNEPIRARQIGPVERAIRWAKRNPAVSFLATAVAASLILGMLMSSIMAVWAFVERGRSKTNEADAVAKGKIADEERQKAEAEEKKARDAERESKLVSGRLALDRGIMLCEQGNIDAGLHWFVRSLELLPADAVELADVARRNLSGWQTYSGSVASVFRVKDFGGGMRFLDKPNQLAVGGQIWDIAASRVVDEILLPKDRSIFTISQDRKLALVTERQSVVRLWDLQKQHSGGPAWEHRSEVVVGIFSHDGEIVATTCKDNTLWRWDVKTGMALGGPTNLNDLGICMAVSPDNQTLAVGGYGSLSFFNMRTGAEAGKRVSTRADAVCFTSDGKNVVYTGGGSIACRRVATGEIVGTPIPREETVKALAITPDGRGILSGGWGGVAHYHRARDGIPLNEPPVGVWPQGSAVAPVAVAPHGAALAVGTATGVVRVRNAPTETPARTVFRHSSEIAVASLTPDEKELVFVDKRRQLHSINVQSGKGTAGPFQLPSGGAVCLAVHDDGKTVAIGRHGPLIILDRLTGKNAAPDITTPSFVFLVAWGPGNRQLVAAQGGGQVQLWTLGESRPNWQRGFGSHVRNIAFSRDGQRVLLAFLNGSVQTYDRFSGRDVGLPLQLPGPAGDLARIGEKWRISCSNLSVFEWDGDSQRTQTLLQHSSIVRIMQFDADSRTLLTSGRPHGTRLWDVATGRPITPPMHEPIAVGPLLTRDGRTVFYANDQGQIRKWSSPIPVDGDIAKLKLWISVVTGTEMNSAGVITPLEPEDWQRRKSRLQALGSSPQPYLDEPSPLATEKQQTTALPMSPANPALERLEQAKALQKQKKLTESETAAREAIRLDPNLHAAHEFIAAMLESQQKFAQAEDATREWLRVHPDDVKALTMLAKILDAQKKHAESEAAWRRTIRLDPNRSWRHEALGWSLNVQAKFADAEKEFRESIRLDSKSVGGRHGLGRALLAQKKSADAITPLREAVSLGTKDHFVFDALGWALLEQQKPAEAESAFRDAIRLKADFFGGHFGIGRALVDQKKFAEAETPLREAARLEPANNSVLDLLHQALLAQGKRTEAEKLKKP